MIATIILAIIIFTAFFYILYARFFKKGNSGCHDCEDIGCPLVNSHQESRKK
nr:FeoB-associated Cys-rich membrane protein [Liquorilactobacillus cacaonum]